MAAASELVVADDPADWARLGFAPDAADVVALGPLAVRLAGRGAGEGIVALVLDGDVAGDVDGLPVRGGGSGPPGEGAAEHRNGALAIDHVVVFTDDCDRTTAALVAAGEDVRRRGSPPELPVPMAFVRFGSLIVEVAQAGGATRFWGLTVVVADLDAAAAHVGVRPRDAVQPGRRILAVPRDAGLSTALALISPRPAPPPPAKRG